VCLEAVNASIILGLHLLKPRYSATTFTGCVGYLFYDWRREKGDKLAKEIERKVKETLYKLKQKA